MNEIDDLTLMAYLDGELDPAEHARIRRALAADPAARQRLDCLQEQDALVGAVLSEALTAPMPPLRALHPAGAGSRPGWRQAWASWFRPWLRPAQWLPLLVMLAVAGTLGGFVGHEQGLEHAGRLQAEANGLPLPPLSRPHRELSRALETGPSGQRLSWERPELGLRGQVMPVRTYQTEGGIYCREFVEERLTATERISLQGIACRTDTGWQLRQQRSQVF